MKSKRFFRMPLLILLSFFILTSFNNKKHNLEGLEFNLSGNNQIVLETYLHSLLNPSSFDRYVQTKIIPNKTAYFECFNTVQYNLIKTHQFQTEHCPKMPDAISRQSCYDTDEAKFTAWFMDINKVINGTSWLNTISGQAAELSQQIVGRELMSNIVNAVHPYYKAILSCF